MNQTQKQNMKRRNTPRLPIVYTTAEMIGGNAREDLA